MTLVGLGNKRKTLEQLPLVFSKCEGRSSSLQGACPAPWALLAAVRGGREDAPADPPEVLGAQGARSALVRGGQRGLRPGPGRGRLSHALPAGQVFLFTLFL